MNVFVIIPAYNEEKYISGVVQGIRQENSDCQIVVVDDGSDDATARLAAEAGVIVLCHLLNRGQGAALQTGTQFALKQGARVIVHFDGDGQFEAKEIRNLITPIVKGEADVVLGSRFLLPGSRIPWSKKWLILPLARFLNFLITSRWLSDAHNGFRAFSADACRLVTIEQDRMAHGTEIVEKIARHNLRCREVPVTVQYHRYGQGLIGGLAILKDLIIQKIIS